MDDNRFDKDPDAVLDYVVDWSNWLAAGETITSHTITSQAGITVDSSSESDGKVTIWLSGGTVKNTYAVACKIVTSAGRTDERMIHISVFNR